jgi:hypothetical protein
MYYKTVHVSLEMERNVGHLSDQTSRMISPQNIPSQDVIDWLLYMRACVRISGGGNLQEACCYNCRLSKEMTHGLGSGG